MKGVLKRLQGKDFPIHVVYPLTTETDWPQVTMQASTSTNNIDLQYYVQSSQNIR